MAVRDEFVSGLKAQQLAVLDVCPDCQGTRTGCGCPDCQIAGGCVACCSEEDFARVTAAWVDEDSADYAAPS